jgi:Protein of unknown function (DUF3047)
MNQQQIALQRNRFKCLVGASLACATALALSACTQMPAQVTEGPVNAATDAFVLPNDALNPAWHAVHIRFKTPTIYTSSTAAGERCIRATADGAWSLWVAKVPPQYAQASTLSWRWHVPALVAEADAVALGKDDSAVRVVIAFKGDRTKLDAAERATMSMAKAIGGNELPFAAIQYVWDAKAEVESVYPNGNTTRIKKLVARSGAAGLGSWQSFSRDVRADFRRAFPGEEPGEIESVGLMTDTDSLGGKTEACYADIVLR